MKKKKFAAGFATFILAFQLTACGSGQTVTLSDNTSATAPSQTETTLSQTETVPVGFQAPDHDNLNYSDAYIVAKEKVTLRFGMSQHPNITDYKDNKLTKWLEETCNVNLEFDLYPSADAASKIRILMGEPLGWV